VWLVSLEVTANRLGISGILRRSYGNTPSKQIYSDGSKVSLLVLCPSEVMQKRDKEGAKRKAKRSEFENTSAMIFTRTSHGGRRCPLVGYTHNCPTGSNCSTCLVINIERPNRIYSIKRLLKNLQKIHCSINFSKI